MQQSQTSHENIKAYKCEFCEEFFGYGSHLVNHEEVIQDNFKAHKCDYCERSFFQEIWLENTFQFDKTGHSATRSR